MPARLLTALREHLTAAGLVRPPHILGAEAPMWLEPRLGTPAPGEGNNPTEVGADIVVGAYIAGGIAPGPFDGDRRKPIVELRYRTRQGYMAEDLSLRVDAQIATRRFATLTSAGFPADITDDVVPDPAFMLSGLFVLECTQVLELQRLGSDEQGFEHTVQYQFELYRD